jgi:GTPase Era involved in 16S rRNA processing
MFKDKDFNIEAKQKLKNTNGDMVFLIGHKNTSCTRIPGWYKKDQIVFVDCPGLQD